MKIAVLAGGFSPEREVSRTSGALVARALVENGHRVCLLDPYLGRAETPPDLSDLFLREPPEMPEAVGGVPDLEALRARSGNGEVLIGANVAEICRYADAVFLALHGGAGENGQLQAFLDLYHVPYTGSGYGGSLLAMNKDLAKSLFRGANVPTPAWTLCGRATRAEEVIAAVGLPCVLKPADGGSSVGVRFAETEDELQSALTVGAGRSRLLAETKITGRELTVGILGERVLPPVEIRPKQGFYDYRNKYAGDTEEICPAPIPAKVAARLSEYARRAFRALGLRGYARLDFLLDAEDRLWCLEANTLPGMTPTSLFPLEAATVGISYHALCEILIRMAIDR